MDAEHDPNLRKSAFYYQTKWTLEQIRAGIEYYKELYGKYPSSNEIDDFEYLPTSRTIQRSLGGLEAMRKALGFDISLTNLTKGTIRSEISKKIYSDAVKLEEAFYKYLIKTVPEVKVHEHKILRPGHVCCDFFIYTSDTKGFAIDIFYAQDLNSVTGILRIKDKRYRQLKCPIYFVLVGNQQITKEALNAMISNKKIPMSPNIQVLIEKDFKEKFNIWCKRGSNIS